MQTAATKQMDDGPESLVQELNALLVTLSIPLTITTIYDLTPSLLLAILESILRARLPISNVIRESQSRASKVEAMKILLGVLEDDILHIDIGLSEIDPRSLAAGEWDDLVFVAETLCWVARHQGVLRSSTTERPERGEPSSSLSSMDLSAGAGASVYAGSFQDKDRGAPESSLATTSVSSDVRSLSRTRTPRCIHEVEAPSFSMDTSMVDLEVSADLCDCPEFVDEQTPSIQTKRQETLDESLILKSTLSSVRYEGGIQLAEDDVPSFEARRGRDGTGITEDSVLHRNIRPRYMSNKTSSASEGMSSPYYTLLLLQERARLLGELAKSKRREGRVRFSEDGHLPATPRF